MASKKDWLAWVATGHGPNGGVSFVRYRDYHRPGLHRRTDSRHLAGHFGPKVAERLAEDCAEEYRRAVGKPVKSYGAVRASYLASRGGFLADRPDL